MPPLSFPPPIEFVKHSKWGKGLNHDVTTSDRSVPTPTFLKYEFVMHSKCSLGLNHDVTVTTSDRSVPTPTFLKINPRLRGVSG
jgi:hypothetical protein